MLPEKIKLEMHRTITFAVLHGYETWSVTLREEHRLNMFYNTVLRKVRGPESDEVTGECSRLHNEDLTICIAHRMLLGCPGDHAM